MGNPAGADLTCQWCGGPLPPKTLDRIMRLRSRHRFCSDRCERLAWIEAHKADPLCVVCRQEPSRPGYGTCEECAPAPRPAATGLCLACAAPLPGRRSRLYCNRGCQSAYLRSVGRKR